MLPFALKIAWFCLSLIGTVCCWIVFLSFCQAVDSYWPLIYCIGCTLTQVAFCLGMIYKMDPMLMPYGFCVSQSIVIGLGVFVMTGVAATFGFATTYASYKPKTWRNGRKGIMVWRPVYLLSTLLFPLVASAIQVAVTFQADHRGRNDDLHCDYSDPTWIRFMTYAGTPWLLTVPCFYFSVTSIMRIHKTNKHLERSRDPDMDIGGFTSMPRRPQQVRMARPSSTSSRPLTPPSASRQTSSPTLTENRGSRSYPIQTALSLNTRRSSISSMRSEESHSRVSSSFPTFANPPNMGTVPIDPDRLTVSSTTRPREEWREILGVAHAPADKAESLKWTEDGDKVDFNYGKAGDDFATEDGRSEVAIPPSTPPHVIIDVAKQRTPAPFGTQHIALLMSVWGPVIVFGE
ncbi:hypothetical protein DXG01_014438 [Tephrocybe rancida]|nr:hypothetical protein DXG01_014438 [Tephrocybe rancida]